MLDIVHVTLQKIAGFCEYNPVAADWRYRFLGQKLGGNQSQEAI